MSVPPALPEFKRAKPFLGTLVDIRVRHADEARARDALAAAFAEIAEIHDLMSFHQAGSDLDRLNCAAAGDWVAVDARTAEVLACATLLQRESMGAFDAGVADALVASGRLPAAANEAPLPRAAAPNRRRTAPVPHQRGSQSLDLGGIAKGYAVDAAIEILRERGMDDALVNAGGDLRCFGQTEREIQLRDPLDPSRIVATLRLRNGALASSSTRALFEQASEGSSPIVDPSSRKLLADGAGASVLAPSALWADGLTKVVLVSGDPEHPALALHDARTAYFRRSAPS